MRQQKKLTSKLEKASNNGEKILISKKLDKINKELFEFDKLLYKPQNKVPKINFDDFAVEKKTGLDITKTVLEQKQINIQNKINPTLDEKSAANYIFGDGYVKLDGWLWDSTEFQDLLELLNKNTKKQLIKELMKHRDNLDKLIEKMPGLTQNTKLFRRGSIDLTLRVGDKGILKGYGHTSYQKSGTSGFNEDKYMIEIYALKGQKGLAANARNGWGSTLQEHELLLPRNQEYILLDVDPIKKNAKILLI